MSIQKKTSLLLMIFFLLIISSVTLVLQNQSGSNIPVSVAQSLWAKNYGGPDDDRAFYATTEDNGYLVIGSTRSFEANTTVGWSLFVDNSGNSVWNKTFLLNINSEFRYSLKINDGFLLIGNEFLHDGNTRGVVVYTDNSGNVVWTRAIEGHSNKLFSAILDKESVYLLGLCYITDAINSCPLVIKTDLAGNILWEKSFPEKTNGCFREGAIAQDGALVATGYFKNQTSGSHVLLLMKIDSEEKLSWDIAYASDKSQKAYSLAKVSDGYVIVGEAESEKKDIEGLAIKIDWTGKIVWNMTIGGIEADSASTVTSLEDGSCLVAGFTFSYGAVNRDIWFFKISNQGKVDWICTNGDLGYQEAYRILPIENEHYILVGWTDPPESPDLIGHAKYDFYIAELQIKS